MSEEEAASVEEPASEDSTSSRVSSRMIAAVVGLFVVGFIALLAFAGGGDDAASSRLVNKRVPEVSGISLISGTQFDIDAHRGQWVLVNFFATWCPGCVVEHPDLVRLDEWGTETGQLQLVSVVFNDQPEDIVEFFAENGGAWPVLSDPSLAITFQVSLVPESFLINPDGIVVAHVPGGITEADVLNAIGGS